MNLNLRPKEECMFDAVSLGEVMLRLDPGEGRIRTARSFRAWACAGSIPEEFMQPFLNSPVRRYWRLLKQQRNTAPSFPMI